MRAASIRNSHLTSARYVRKTFGDCIPLSFLVGNDIANNLLPNSFILTGAGLRVAVQFTVQAAANGTIVAQEPAPGTQAGRGSTVTVTLSVSGEVPDTEGMSVGAATDQLQSYGYRIGTMKYTSSEGSDGNVVRTDPDVGTNLQPGSTVTLIVNGP